MEPSLERDETFLEVVAALKHDLGKYVAWTSANLAPDAWSKPVADELFEALQRDLLETRRDREGKVEAAWELWARYAQRLAKPWPPELEAVDHAVSELRRAEPALRGGDPRELDALAEPVQRAQMEIRTQLRALHRRLLKAN